MAGDGRIDGRSLRFRHRRPQLLAAATEYVLDHGVGGLSLRPVAAALGVTHATLLRHFSSKDELVLSVLDKIRDDLAEQLTSDPEYRAARSMAELIRAVWRRLCEPREQRQFLLLFEIVGHHSWEADADRELGRILIGGWVDIIIGRLARDERPAEDATALATLILAQIRGLQIDLLVTGDRERADRALELSLRLLATDRPDTGD
ncbi:TetR/AcrR family transcriptional regulator [Streptomyces arenae]|uniref:TetR/AcrR family transcriptional regulator n=1 Tax=Streptomyces arenae TaxID=29301 RepID=UPI002659D7EA|nr:TetR/AcrR family transcriptional regulator [Streptomyces arenae]MCG7205092.1 TetR/AcrR family transcriptional regulator [Streptomyces arenae]